MMESPKRDEFDLFISYAHTDDRGAHAGKVTALVEAIKADYLAVTGTPLRAFFDTDEIRSMDAWEARILTGLRQSKMMVAILSPSYFASAYCLKEWEIYVETELALALPGEGITPIYVVRHPAFETDPVEEQLRHWIKDLRSRQYIEWLPFWPEGAAALERQDVRRKLADLPGQIADRLHRAAIRDTTPHTVPLPSIHFVGRRDEMHALLHDLLQSQIGAITAVHGIPGIGKSMLAFAYAWGYGFRYPGGRFLIAAANASDLAAEVIRLAEPKGVPLSDEERQRPDVALAKVKAAFEAGPPALLVIDNVDDPALLTAQARERALPKGDHIHVLVTTRISPEDLPRIRCLPLDALQTQDAMALLQSFRPIADSPQDDEWKAALEIVGRLGGHALGVEVVAVYLRENPQVTYRVFAEGLQRDGIELMDTTAGPEARKRLAWHTETCIRRLLEPTLASLSPAELRAVEYAAILPPDNLPLPWLRDLLTAQFPERTHPVLGDPVAKVFQRLERLRLVVSQARGREPGAGQATTGDARLARMHRLVQDVVRARLGADDLASREVVVHQLAYSRAGWIKAHWGQVGLAWELRPLRDIALRLITRGDRQGCLMADSIAAPLTHTGRLLDARDLYRRSADLFAGLSNEAPENADYARDLSVSYNKLGDLARSGGDPAAARRFYEDGLTIRQRLADAAPENADYARDLWVSYWKMAALAENSSSEDEALPRWRRAYDVLSGMKRRGVFLSPEDEGFLDQLARKVGR